MSDRESSGSSTTLIVIQPLTSSFTSISVFSSDNQAPTLEYMNVSGYQNLPWNVVSSSSWTRCCLMRAIETMFSMNKSNLKIFTYPRFPFYLSYGPEIVSYIWARRDGSNGYPWYCPNSVILEVVFPVSKNHHKLILIKNKFLMFLSPRK